MADPFYRYMRPCVYNFHRNESSYNSRGGLCFKVEALGQQQGLPKDVQYIRVSYSICHENDVFSKAVAKKIADERWAYGHTYTVPHYLGLEETQIAKSLIRHFEILPKLHDEGAPRRIYMDYDLELLTIKIQQIFDNWRGISALFQMDREVIEALHLRKLYEQG